VPVVAFTRQKDLTERTRGSRIMTEDCPKAGGVLWVSCVDHEARPVAHGKSAGDPILQRVLVKEIPRRTSMGANVRQWGRRCQTIFKVVGWILNHMKYFVPPQINIARTCPACCRCQSKSNEREMSYQVKPTRFSLRSSKTTKASVISMTKTIATQHYCKGKNVQGTANMNKSRIDGM
jgi:hypothetical protein